MTNNIPPPKNIILYADDDSDDLALLEDAFSHYAQSVELVTVSNGAEALDYLQKLPDSAPTPCLIILDVNMPKMNGKEVLVELREQKRFAATPVILFTTSSMPQDKAFAAHYKAGFLTKPIHYKQLEEIGATFLKHCTAEVQKKISKLMR